MMKDFPFYSLIALILHQSKAPFSHHPLPQILYRVRILSVPVVLEHFQRSPPIRIQANDEILLAPNSPRQDSPTLKSRTLHMIVT